MRLPFVSRARYEEAQAIASRVLHRARRAEAHAEMQQHNLAEMRRMYDDVFAAYKELRAAGQEAPRPLPPMVDSPLSQLGPLTKLALKEMSHGIPRDVRQAMQSKALAIWQQNRGEESQDELTAIAVRQGEQIG